MSTHSDDVSVINRAIGGRVAWYMKYSGGPRRTQAELGTLLDLDQSGVSKKLRGDRPFATHELYRIAAWLDRPLGDFLPVAEEIDAPPRLPRPQAVEPAVDADTSQDSGSDIHQSAALAHAA